MKNNVLEEFNQLTLDSYWIRVINDYEDPTFYLIDVRIITDGNLKSYYFHGLLEMYQRNIQIQEQKNCLVINEESNWVEIFIKENNEKESEYMEINEELLKHYIFRIGEIEFNILAEGYHVDNNFREMFRQQEKIKNLVS
ncbi:hypothetical protein F3J23_14265 [Chryseobacterium sp. Tr-659]|uniref:hypothetical protein n=1 Tax=Chryseobacterium sp. Tr-659 TaxID=2608340 RepID=UPI001422AF3F|nr:hypothetical protein [Chryseobacterium sp. Tr-659]NIF06610.1 hypothetical protein [Chryseobacterium sp. Tr-659]